MSISDMTNPPEQPDVPQWWSEYEAACYEIGREPNQFDLDDEGYVEAVKEMEQIKRTVESALEVM